MRRIFFVFIAIAFLLRGFMGDAMAVSDAHATVGAAANAPAAQSCHQMAMEGGESDKTSSMNHADCRLCCAAVAIPSLVLLVFDQAENHLPEVSFTSRFSSNDLLPAFKPPIL